MLEALEITILYEPIEDGWVMASIAEVPGAISQGKSREEARVNVIDALRTMLTPDDEFAGATADGERERLQLTIAA